MTAPPRTDTGYDRDVLFGTEVADPYRWLEGDLHGDARIREWADAQQRYTDEHLRELPHRDAIKRHLQSIWAFEKFGCPMRRGARCFYEWNDGRARHHAVVVQDSLEAARRVLVDPNAMDEANGDVVHDWQPSPGGAKVAYTLQRHGGDWRTLRFVDAASGAALPDVLEGLKAAQYAWHPDESRVYYTRFAAAGSGDNGAPTFRSSVYEHRLGDPQASDALAFEGEDGLLHLPRVSDDGHWLVLASSNAGGTKVRVRAKRVSRADAPWLDVVGAADARWSFLGGDASRLFFLTDRDAPLGRIVAIDPSADAGANLATVVAEGGQAIRGATLAGDEIVVQTLEGLRSTLRRHARNGRLVATVQLPPDAVVDQMRGSAQAAELFVRASSMASPPAIHRCDLSSGRTSTFAAPAVPWSPDDYVIRQITATSAEGTAVPITIARRRELDDGAPKATVLMVYGGFGISPDLSFWESRFGWLSLGGVFAIAHTRGGAEFGSAWADAGRKAGRLKVVADYVAAATALCDRGIASPRSLVALGASNGGLVVAAATNARPDLFAATLARVPMIDLLRYTRFTLGKIWVDELGDPEVEEDFRGMLAYSPLHNVRAGADYPAMLVTTADADDRVVPSHSFKYIATLQALASGSRPRLVRIEFGAGHGEGKPADRLVDEFTDLWAFAARYARLGLGDLAGS